LSPTPHIGVILSVAVLRAERRISRVETVGARRKKLRAEYLTRLKYSGLRMTLSEKVGGIYCPAGLSILLATLTPLNPFAYLAMPR